MATYIVSPIFSNEEVHRLHDLRSRSTECRANYKQKNIHTDIAKLSPSRLTLARLRLVIVSTHEEAQASLKSKSHHCSWNSLKSEIYWGKRKEPRGPREYFSLLINSLPCALSCLAYLGVMYLYPSCTLSVWNFQIYISQSALFPTLYIFLRYKLSFVFFLHCTFFK